LPSTRAIETPSLPNSLAATHRGFALITRTAQYSRQLPSCIAVYPRDSPSHVFYVAFPESSLPDRDVSYVAYPKTPFALRLTFDGEILQRIFACPQEIE
jgi:hypothetical protein